MKEEQTKLAEKFCEILKLKNFSSNSIKNYKSRLISFISFFSQKDIRYLSKRDLKKYFRYCTVVRNYSVSTLKQQLNFIKLFFQTVYEKKLDLDFVKNLNKEYKLPTVLNSEEITRILHCNLNLKHKLIIATIYSCGLRLQETVDLKISNIDTEKKIIRINQSRGNNFREIMLSEKLIAMIKNYRKIYEPKVWLFENPYGQQYCTRNIQLLFKRALKKAGVNQAFSVYSLRHSFALHLLESGTDVKYIQKLLGHNNIKSTQIYTYICRNSIKEIKSPLDRLNI